MKKKNMTPLAAAVGAAFLTSAAISANAEAANPFAAVELSAGYNLSSTLDGHKGGEGKCGEGKCGEGKDKKKEGKCGEGKCGEGKDKKKEGKCGEGKCGEDTDKKKEGKCGEGKCGS
ncbi:HvfA family oxazolone/thioamide-modified RiPP metallophore [Biformimicrobium ophioploci]|nr:hypothetical protein [Microbulbifer sp. NKW57]